MAQASPPDRRPADATVKAATTHIAAAPAAPRSKPNALAPSTSAAKAICAAVLSLLTMIGWIATGRSISRETMMAETIMMSRDTTTIASQPGSTPITDRVT
jgi:hypothetical protein